MIHRQHFNFYIASCDADGGVLMCEFEKDTVRVNKKIDFDRPMYMAFDDGKIRVLLRDPESKNESGLATINIENGTFEKADGIISTNGCVACHLCVSGGNVYCVNYLSGNVVKMPDKVITHIGSGPNIKRQDMSHTHYINSFDGKYLLCTDLGTDEIYTYDRDLNEIYRTKLPDGHGPRHLEFSHGRVYCLNELKSTLSVLDYKDGRLVLNETVSVLDKGFRGESYAAAIREKDGLIYVSNRGSDTISVLKPYGRGAKLLKSVDCAGQSPRDFNIFGNILICTNEKSDNITFFELKDGIPEKLDIEIKAKSPVCVI